LLAPRSKAIILRIFAMAFPPDGFHYSSALYVIIQHTPINCKGEIPVFL